MPDSKVEPKEMFVLRNTPDFFREDRVFPGLRSKRNFSHEILYRKYQITRSA